jgi:type II secretory pathway pseudopilin PulG
MTQRKSWRPARGAAWARFTLPELLIVIAVLLVLVALLLPSLSRAMYQARLVLCVNNIRQWTIALTSYAEHANGNFRADPTNAASGNAWDISTATYRDLREFGLEVALLQCPLTPPANEKSILTWEPCGLANPCGFAITGYGYWVPRLAGSGAGMLPPDNCAGPRSLMDTKHLQNPIVADSAAFLPGTTLPNPFYQPQPPYSNVPHRFAGDWESMTHGYADGHVEKVPWRLCRYRYTSFNNNHDNWY